MWRSTLVGMLILGTPVVGQAEELAFYYGATVAKGYVSRGIIYTEDVYVSPWVELGYGNFYAGAYLSNVDEFFVFDAYSMSNGVYVGYRSSAGDVSYDATLYYYIYDGANDTSPNYFELVLDAAFAPTPSTYLTAEVVLDKEYDSRIGSLRLDYYTPVENLSVGVEYGRANTNYGDWDYGIIDASYSLNSNISLGLAYNYSTYEFNSPDADFNYDDPAQLVTASINFSF
ncbi:MAG: hypothetical protein HC794_00420 [Nitrospiraceae bacterium]|nr:hypothetical protein [Nitrospiraceae bacterium]